jgi:ribonucleoside-diphosphate reductase alpha chain
LSSINLETYDEWKDDKNFVEDVMRFLDNILSEFIEKAPELFQRCKIFSVS